MDFEQDYIMRMIKDMVRALMMLVLNKKDDRYELPADNELTDTDLKYKSIKALADQGKLNEAENALYEDIPVDDKHYLEMALEFYLHLNAYSDEFLEEHNFSRQEIIDGIKNIARVYGVEGLEEILD